MPLDRTTLKNGIIQLHTDMSDRETNSITEYAERLTLLLESFVKSGKVQTGITVTVSGSSGTTTSQGNII